MTELRHGLTHRLTETVVASTLLAYGHMTSRRRPLFWKTFRNESHVPSDPGNKFV